MRGTQTLGFCRSMSDAGNLPKFFSMTQLTQLNSSFGFKIRPVCPRNPPKFRYAATQTSKQGYKIRPFCPPNLSKRRRWACEVPFFSAHGPGPKPTTMTDDSKATVLSGLVAPGPGPKPRTTTTASSAFTWVMGLFCPHSVGGYSSVCVKSWELLSHGRGQIFAHAPNCRAVRQLLKLECSNAGRHFLFVSRNKET